MCVCVFGYKYMTQCRSEHILYQVEYEVELGVCVCVCVCVFRFKCGWAYLSEVKKKGKEKFFFLLRCQITG